MNEIASLNVNSGPPLRPMYGLPSSVNSTVIAEPGSPGPASVYLETFPIFELGKIAT